MKVNKIFVGENNTEVEIGGGSGSAINASLVNYKDSNGYRTFIRCNKDEIVDTDSVRLAREINRVAKEIDGESHASKGRYKGWITPANAQLEYSGLNLTMELDHSDENYDYWEVTNDGDALTIYEGERNKELGEGGISLARKCAFFVERDGVRITGYMKFRISKYPNPDSGEDVYVMAIWK